MVTQRFLPTSSLAYVRDQLLSGVQFLREITADVNWNDGEVFTLADDSLIADALLRPAEGGKASRRVSIELTAAFIGQMLRREPDTLFLVENTTARPGDAWLEDENAGTSEIVIYKEEVYHKAYVDRSDAHVRDAILAGESVAPPVVGVIAALPKDCPPVFQAAKVIMVPGI